MALVDYNAGMSGTARSAIILGIALAGLIMPGCVRRTISVTSDPSGALLWLNGREIGRTPVEVDFVYYGDYDVVLVADGYETLLTHGKADAPLWDVIPFDLVAELTPGRKQARIEWHYQLEPRDDDPARLLERARQLRDRATEPIDSKTQEQIQPPAE